MDGTPARYTMIIDGDPQDLDGAVAEFRVNPDFPGVVRAEIRIPGPPVP